MPVMLAATCAWSGKAPARIARTAAKKHGHADLVRSTFAGKTAEDLDNAIECIVEPPERRDNSIQFVSLCQTDLIRLLAWMNLYGLRRVWTLWLVGRILCGMTLSARNRLEGKVVEIQVGGVMAHVVISVGKNLIESVITKRSADEMKLKVGDTVSAVIKSTEVMLEKN
jgi:molybdopterin-binding protein